MNIHQVLEAGTIVANDESLDVLFTYSEEAKEVVMFQGDTNGNYEISDTRKDVEDDDDDIEDAVEEMLESPD